VIDDGDQLTSLTTAAHLETVVRHGRDANIRVVAAVEMQAAGRTFSGWLSEIRKDEHGVLIDPQPDQDGAVLGVRLPKRTVASLPGRGYFVRRGLIELVQVALPAAAMREA
jgi:hypothetical protein